ncbi:hypothetical protein F5887DRAFT_953202 [Amanita rubescens]|nr:hypothetical protein F5887DRAFT_953202 [Amanita rubescens]
MHTISHSIAHRAPPAARTRVRWQPYSSIPSTSMTTSLPSPPTKYLNTPPASTASSPSSLKPNPPGQSSLKHISQTIKDACVKDISKNKFALGLVDQAVKCLCEIWRAQDIPSIFLNCNTSQNRPRDKNEQKPSHPPEIERNLQLLSPSSSSPRVSQPTPASHLTSTCSKDIEQPPSKNCLLPIKGFVHEVLRRSRTSGCVLQTALCYIEALRPMIPELIRREKVGELRWKELELAERIVPATDAELQQHAEEDMLLDNIINTNQCSAPDPIPCIQVTSGSNSQDGNVTLVAAQSDCHGIPMPRQLDPYSCSTEHLSPLLCPRRSFLAALILASKFIQDKCYSNRAWAKLSGLSPREIGRCERALGEALEWRLWVGKLPAAGPTNRSLCRTQSESCLQAPPSDQTSFLIRNEAAPPSAASNRTLRRSSTLPADAFSSDHNVASSSRSHATPDVAATVPIRMLTLAEIKDDSPSSQSSTPPLTYSPTSTESSSGGDRTIQVSFQEPLEESCHMAPNFDTGCMPCMELSDQLTGIAPTPPPFALKGLAPMPGLESTTPNPYIGKGGGDVSGTTLMISGDDLGATVGPLEGYLPHTWRVEESVSLDFGFP